MKPMHALGDLIRDGLQQMPMSIVRVLLVATLVGLLVWVLRLPKEVAEPPGGARRWDENLKVGAAVALLIQIAIYCWL